MSRTKLILSFSLFMLILFFTGCGESDTKVITKPIETPDDQVLVGESCGTVTPGQNDECCERKMKDEPHPDCDGGWKYLIETNKCEYKCTKAVDELGIFCGASSGDSCSIDEDCEPVGCSKQICARKGKDMMTTCEYRDCYNAEDYGVRCGCFDSKCDWG
ncbi:eight-cysteine-cluster domain-containing protein [Nanoarchaeota archaeon]